MATSYVDIWMSLWSHISIINSECSILYTNLSRFMGVFLIDNWKENELDDEIFSPYNVSPH